MSAAVVFAACLAPFLRLAWLACHAGLSPNPVAFVEHRTGDWAINLLCAALALRPLARLTGSSWFMKRRRMVGLFAFFYACLHFTTYLVFDLEFDLGQLAEDLVKRRYILVGFSAFLLMAALAATSTDGMIRRLRKNWQRLHRLVYACAVLAVVHYWWLVKKDHHWPAIYGVAVGSLLGCRLLPSFWRKVVV